MSDTKSTVLRYCHVVGHNVYMEIKKTENTETGPEYAVNCLNYHLCSKERGGCGNVLVNGAGSKNVVSCKKGG